ncbi:TetR/AcrR family transcriptional regulator [Paramicrobacterium humi]|uniref:TetR/AcrR family transcriptional regulator n=1 Tax=Paramicrobacterium humi TaxID=640635 RepID=UPI0015A2D1BE|nr:TetR/AcrR family transcriptional regulator [Microbacterium humi]
MQTATPLGHRERKREQTRARIEAAAAEIVLTDGLDALTIDAIVARADVSRRTFFNYFDGKDDAVLGFRHSDETEALVAQQLVIIESTDAVEGVVRLLFGLMGTAGADLTLEPVRRRILQDHPELLQRKFNQMHRVHSALGAATVELMKRDHRFAATEIAEAQAQVLLMMCTAAVKSVALELLGADASGEPMIERATELVKDVTEKIA